MGKWRYSSTQNFFLKTYFPVISLSTLASRPKCKCNGKCRTAVYQHVYLLVKPHPQLFLTLAFDEGEW
jgi:hypothetical protein